MSRNKFTFYEVDINKHLNSNWDTEIVSFSQKYAIYKLLKPCSVTSRESKTTKEVETLTVDGIKIREGLPWLFELYENELRIIGSESIGEKLLLAKNDQYALNLNIQKGCKMRYECHIDSNPLQGVLYVTTHAKGEGGELVVSNNSQSIGTKEIDEDCEVIYPRKGMLYLFNATKNPHYVRPLKNSGDTRVAVTINFYTSNNPESSRPEDLNNHLFNT